MCEPETKVPQPHSPSPSHAAPRFQLQPSAPEISTCHASNSTLLKRMQESTCFNCGQKGHWSWYCPLKSPNNNNNHLSPVSTKQILCRCGHGFCNVKTAYNSRNWGKKYFVCPIKRDHGSCGYRVSEDEVLNNTSIVPMSDDDQLNNTSIVPIRQSRQRSLHEFWEDQNETADNNLGEGAGGDLFVTPKRMRVIDNSESPSPMALSQIPEEKDRGSANSQHVCFPRFEVDEDDLELSHLALDAIEAAALSRLSTPSRIHRRQSLFERDIAGADASFGSWPMGSHSKCNDQIGISKDIASPNKSPSSESKLGSMSQIQIDVVKFTQQRLLSDLVNLDPRQHESMAEAAESTFEVLNRLGVECNQFSEHVWDFIRLASSMAEMDKSMENSPTLEERDKLFEEDKARLAPMRDDCIKTEALLETSKIKGKSLCEEVFHLEAMLYQKRIELKSCESETMKLETKLGDLKRDMSEVDINLKDLAEQMELARKQSAERQAKQIAAQAALEKAKLVLEN